MLELSRPNQPQSPTLSFFNEGVSTIETFTDTAKTAEERRSAAASLIVLLNGFDKSTMIREIAIANNLIIKD